MEFPKSETQILRSNTSANNLVTLVVPPKEDDKFIDYTNGFYENKILPVHIGFKNEVASSKRGLNCINPIRIILESLAVKPNPEKAMISLSQGDPTLYNLFPIDENMKKAVVSSVDSGMYNSYLPSAGMDIALKAISEQYELEGIIIHPKNIFLTTGCTQALLWAIESLADKGDHILFSKPCFPIYKTFAQMNGIEFSCFDLLPDQDWEVDIEHLESLITPKTKAILINNPSNPCGSVYSKEHIMEIIEISSRYAIPIVLDEVYAHFVFPGRKYCSFTSCSKSVPILICNSLSKRYIVPGWRVGWIAIYDPTNCMHQVRESINRFSQASFGVNSMIQASLPEIFKNTPSSYFQNAVTYAHENAKIFYEGLSKVSGITPIMSQGSMFLMVRIDLQNFPTFADEFEIVEKLIAEESVFPFPSSIFGMSGYLRISLIIPHDKAEVAVERMADFFTRHYTKF